MPRDRLGEGPVGRTSGEYSDLLLAAIKELREDQREFRTHVGTKLDAQGTQISSILVTLADGTGRMNYMQQTITALDQRLKNIESASGVHKAISASAISAPEEKSGGWISVDKLPAIITAIGSLIAVVVSTIALAKTPVVPVAPPPTSSATTNTPP